MPHTSERGEGRLGSIVTLVVLAALGYAAWNVGPVYFANYALADKMNEIARAPRGTNPDEKIMDVLMKEVRARGLDAYIKRTNFTILTQEFGRKISCSYDRTVEVLPGWSHTFKFRNQADQPLIY